MRTRGWIVEELGANRYDPNTSYETLEELIKIKKRKAQAICCLTNTTQGMWYAVYILTYTWTCTSRHFQGAASLTETWLTCTATAYTHFSIARLPSSLPSPSRLPPSMAQSLSAGYRSLAAPCTCSLFTLELPQSSLICKAEYILMI